VSNVSPVSTSDSVLTSNRPVEIFQLMIKPADFFTANPSLDVPSSRNAASRVVQKECCRDAQL
jgi:primary-amine oxidase